MWYQLDLHMPYGADPDYERAVVAAVKSRLGADTRVDVTLVNSGSVEVEPRNDEELAKIHQLVRESQLFTGLRTSIDRDMIREENRRYA